MAALSDETKPLKDLSEDSRVINDCFRCGNARAKILKNGNNGQGSYPKTMDRRGAKRSILVPNPCRSTIDSCEDTTYYNMQSTLNFPKHAEPEKQLLIEDAVTLVATFCL